jgi:hypothetical protein
LGLYLITSPVSQARQLALLWPFDRSPLPWLSLRPSMVGLFLTTSRVGEAGPPFPIFKPFTAHRRHGVSLRPSMLGLFLTTSRVSEAGPPFPIFKPFTAHRRYGMSLRLSMLGLFLTTSRVSEAGPPFLFLNLSQLTAAMAVSTAIDVGVICDYFSGR